MARTILVEQLDVNPDVIEAQLAHAKSGPLGAAYDRAEFIKHRRVMMSAWADYLEHSVKAKSNRPSALQSVAQQRPLIASVGPIKYVVVRVWSSVGSAGTLNQTIHFASLQQLPPF